MTADEVKEILNYQKNSQVTVYGIKDSDMDVELLRLSLRFACKQSADWQEIAMKRKWELKI